MSTSNIEKVLAQADSVDINEGKVAYQNYHLLMKRIAIYYGAGFAQTVAAFVSLSPNNDYTGNLRSLVTVLSCIKEGKDIHKVTTSAYGHCKLRAYSFLIGEKDFLLETQGLKITNFYCNILRPDDPRFVTIDGHMSNVWAGKVRNMKLALIGKPSKYQQIADGFKKVARHHKLLPNQIQGICWFTWKRINNLRYDNQLNLFGSEDDYWGLKLKPENIQPYKEK